MSRVGKLRTWAAKCIVQCDFELDRYTTDQQYDRFWSCKQTLKQVIAILDGKNVPGLEQGIDVVDDNESLRAALKEACDLADHFAEVAGHPDDEVASAARQRVKELRKL